MAAIAPAVFPETEPLAANLSNLPVRLYHGELDNIVPAASSRAWQRRLLDLDVSASYLEYAGVRHNAWDLAYRNGAALDWLAQFRRNRTPDRGRFVAKSYRYNSAYWVRVAGLDLPYWQALWAPKATPHGIVAKLNTAVVAALTDPAVRRRLSEIGQEISAPEQQTPAEATPEPTGSAPQPAEGAESTESAAATEDKG